MPQNIPINNAMLYALSTDESALRELYFNQWYSNKRKEFYQNNGIRIDTLHKKRNKLISEFFVVEDGKTKMTEGEKPEPVLLEGKSFEDYKKAYDEFANEENLIKI